MSQTPFAELWRERAAAAVLDPRIHFWHMNPKGDRLCVRPGPALELVSELAAELGDSAPQYLILDKVETFRVNVVYSALRREPSHAAEQISQLRLGQCFRSWTTDAEGSWHLGQGPDGYPGWMRAWHLCPGGEVRPDLVLTARHGTVLAEPTPGAALISDLSFGSEIAASGEVEGGFLPCLLPDGRRGWTAISDLAPIGRPDLQDTRETLLRRAEGLLGVPYDWGGSCSRGFDCSGLVQTLLGTLGIRLPRDADLQAEQGVDKATGSITDWRTGDLFFYGKPRIDHVGILHQVHPPRLLHASGEVRLEDLGPGGALKGRPPAKILDPFQCS